MIIDWLYRTTLELSILIGLILLLRPIIRHLLGARVAYWLWLVPLIRLFLPDLPRRPITFLETVDLPGTATEIGELYNSTIEIWTLSRSLPWLWFWVAGLVLCVTIQIALSRHFQNTVKSHSKPFRTDTSRLNDLIAQHGFNRTEIFTTTLSHAPFAAGLINPRIVLPSKFEQQFTTEEQYWVLKHELTHIRRKDLWMQLTGELVRAVFWFNPIIHLALRNFREDQEFACDQTVLSECSTDDRYHYGKALLMGSSPQLVPSVLTFFGKNKERYLMLAKHKNSKLHTALGISLCFSVGLFAFTKAPDSIAQQELPPFADVWDADAAVKFTGKIVKVEYSSPYSYIHVDAVNEDGSITPWEIEGSSAEVLHEKGLDSNALSIGRTVTVTGYQSLDKNCSPKCKANGRDITFE